MTELPVVNSRQVIRALEKAGFAVHHVRGSHYYLKHPRDPTLRVTVPFHRQDLKRGTLRAILRDAGLSVDELVGLLRL
jgi:predicted RNA binding protein YcfA (HicA-like mRNA interferase family)